MRVNVASEVGVGVGMVVIHRELGVEPMLLHFERSWLRSWAPL